MGYAPELYRIVNSSPIGIADDDQLFYTKIYLNDAMRKELSFKLDHRSEIFQNLNGAQSDIELRFKGNRALSTSHSISLNIATRCCGTGKESYIQNTVYSTVPLVIHANGPTKLFLNTLSNYVPKGWNPDDSCLNCWENMIDLEKKKVCRFKIVIFQIFS